MDGRSKISGFGAADIEDEEIKEEKYNTKIYEPKKTVKESKVPIQSLSDSKYIITGEKSGRIYVFDGAGSVVDVNESDVEQILGIKRGPSCCGNKGGAPLFRKVE